mmetsp:Transcript_37321/g.81254  ORF Transcript_37321/g.81254 Transcript_37321/m.81254 type:complete len:335 (-) Transcript_37321:3559-4563(-)
MGRTSPAYRYVRTLLLLISAGTGSIFHIGGHGGGSSGSPGPFVAASTCDCITINSWTTLRSVVQAALSIGALGTRPHILLCPFSITKDHDEQPLDLSEQIFVQCMKERDGDECVIRSVGDDAEAAQLGQPMIVMSSDNAWLQGMTLTGARGGVLIVQEEVKGAKLIDMNIVGNSSPDHQEGSVVDAKWGSLSHVIDTVFTNNVGTALQNRGTMTVVSSRFIGNVATPFFDSSDNIEQGSGVGGAIMNSAGATMVLSDCCLVDNAAETDGPAIWTAGVDGGAGVAEVGGTCAANNAVTGPDAGAGRDCNGVFDQAQNSCSPFNACGEGVCSVSTM